MKEIRQILKQVAGLAHGEKAVLATVVDLKGSGYRLPGARMLIKSNGEATGTVSGGCLEADVMERAQRVLATGVAEVFTYDTTADENSVFGLNMGCRGVMRILMEAVGADSDNIAAIRSVYRKREAVCGAVVIRSEIDSLPIGARISYGETVAELPSLVDDLRTFAESRSNYESATYQVANSFVELAFERISPPVQLYIFGAGVDAVPLSEVAHGLGWEVNVCDHRSAFLTEERFPKCDALVGLDREVAPKWDVDDLTAFVLMNHNYDRDKALLPGALRSKAFYAGALGPKRRTEQMMSELGVPFTEDELSRLRAPAGLDIGGETPEAIAVSVVAEILSVLKNRNGGPLRDRQAPIYDRK
ncbi:MAG: XdhC family protein [bacterium]|nr:XdhC family protein [bacterium]